MKSFIWKMEVLGGKIMKITDILNVSLRNLLRNRSRTIVNSLIIALGIIVLLLTSSLSIGMKDVADKQILQTRTMRDITVLEDNFSSAQRKIDFNQLDNFRKIEHVDLVFPDVQMMMGLYKGDEWLGAGNVRGVPELGLPPLLEGKSFKDSDTNLVIMPDKVSFVKGVFNGKDYIGKEVQIEYAAVGRDNQQKSKKYNAMVVGIYDHTKKDLPPNALFIPMDDMYKLSAENRGLTQENYMKIMTFNTATVIVNKEEYVNPVTSIIEGQYFQTNSINKQLNNMPGAVRFLMIIGGLISLIVLISGAISIGATMLQATKNRTKEIGLMKALGFFNKSVSNIFLLEAIFTGLLGGIIGVTLSRIALFIIEIKLSQNISFEDISLKISLPSIILATVICLFVPYVGSVLPIRKASKISPAEALRSE